MRRRPVPLAALLAGVALLAAACSLPGLAKDGARDGGGAQATPAIRAGRAPARAAKPAWATGAPVRVLMNDHFRYRPSSIMVRAGQRVTFAVTNTGKLSHEFILGDRAAQLDHEREMQAGGDDGMDMDMDAHMHMEGSGHAGADASGTAGLTVPPGQTRRLTWTFDKPGVVLYGCHVLGHWAAGMRGTIVVLSPDRPRPLPALSALHG
jgi:uncharacterized cupredoxin-like copper-binding protein